MAGDDFNLDALKGQWVWKQYTPPGEKYPVEVKVHVDQDADTQAMEAHARYQRKAAGDLWDKPDGGMVDRMVKSGRALYDSATEAVTGGLAGALTPIMRGGQRALSAIPGSTVPSPMMPPPPGQPVFGGQMGQLQDPAASMARSTAEFLVPQDPVTMAVMAATAGTGKALTTAANATWKNALKMATARTSVAVGAGAVGGAAMGEDPYEAGIKGGLMGLTGEVLNTAVNRIMGMGSARAQRIVGDADAASFGSLLERSPELQRLGPNLTPSGPIFQGIRTPDQLRALTKNGKQSGESGWDMLHNEQEWALSKIVETAGNEPKFTAPRGGEPTTETYGGPGYRGISVKSMKNSIVPADEAKHQLSQLFADFKSKENGSLEAHDALRTYEAARKVFMDELLARNPQGVALDLFHFMNDQWRVGSALLQLAEKGVVPRQGQPHLGNGFNMQKIQDELNKEGVQRQLEDALKDRWANVQAVVWRGGIPGARDLLVNGPTNAADAAAVMMNPESVGGVYHGWKAFLGGGNQFVGQTPRFRNLGPVGSTSVRLGSQLGIGGMEPRKDQR